MIKKIITVALLSVGFFLWADNVSPVRKAYGDTNLSLSEIQHRVMQTAKTVKSIVVAEEVGVYQPILSLSNVDVGILVDKTGAKLIIVTVKGREAADLFKRTGAEIFEITGTNLIIILDKNVQA